MIRTKTFSGPTTDTDLESFVKNIPIYQVIAYSGKLGTPERTISIKYETVSS